MIEAQAELPVLVGSNLHLAMGATEIANISASGSALKVELTDAGAREGSLTFRSKAALKAVDSENCKITSVEKVGDSLWQVNLTGRQWGTKQLVELSLQ